MSRASPARRCRRRTTNPAITDARAPTEYTRQRNTASAAYPLKALVVSSSACMRATTSAETCTALSTMAMTRRTRSVVFTVGLEGRSRCRTASAIRVGQVGDCGGQGADLGLIGSSPRRVEAHASRDDHGLVDRARVTAELRRQLGQCVPALGSLQPFGAGEGRPRRRHLVGGEAVATLELVYISAGHGEGRGPH